MKADQRAYQEDLEEGFKDLKTKLLPFISDGAIDPLKPFDFFILFSHFIYLFILFSTFFFSRFSAGFKAGEKDVLSFISGVDEEDKES